MQLREAPPPLLDQQSHPNLGRTAGVRYPGAASATAWVHPTSQETSALSLSGSGTDFSSR